MQAPSFPFPVPVVLGKSTTSWANADATVAGSNKVGTTEGRERLNEIKQ